MSQTSRSGCPLNCPDSCSFLVEKTGTNALRVKGDPRNPITKGFICSKGQALADRIFSPDRILYPLLRQGTGFKRITWEQAYKLIVAKIQQVLETSGAKAIFHHYDYAHNGVLRSLDRRFFQVLGGVTEPRGSMCWGSGYRAQEIDFGALYANDWADLTNAKTIILWGRDPAVTNIHLIPYLLQAMEKGASIIVINPVRIKSAQFATEYIKVKPGTDAALALGLCHLILSERWANYDFIRQHVIGFEEYLHEVKSYTPEKVEEITNIPKSELVALARKISQAGPVSFVLGYGLQRYRGGGNTVRAIDSLAAITGNIGSPGAGVHYAHQYHRGNLQSLFLPEERYQNRTFPHPVLAEELRQAQPAIQLAFVTRSNPLVQQPNSVLWKEVWSGIPFKVVLETHLSETARQADLVLPITTIFEEEDLLYTSWNSMLQLTEAVIEPQGESRPEPVIFTDLAKRLGFEQDFDKTPREWIEYVIEPLKVYNLTIENFLAGPILSPYIPEVAWSDYEFKTPSGKIELFSEIAKQESGYPVATYIPPACEKDAREYPHFLLTPHPSKGIHSQFNEMEGFAAYIHSSLAKKYNLFNGNRVIVETEDGQLIATVQISEDIHEEAVVVPEGSTFNGLGVNQLFKGFIPDYGESTPYYDNRCALRKWQVD
ncbi:MAG: molybdopterin-dependent oxidoreductase [Desulfitobacterium hafniense]|nr:molybdopterin-dependent oxidoreductase [Desulfitobacterium hafniense]